MATLSHLKQKIKSIQATQKITHAVRLTSMSLYTQLEKKYSNITRYTSAVQELFSTIFANTTPTCSSILWPGDLCDSRPLFLVFATTKGLCGSLNSNLFRTINSSIFIDTHQNPSWITVGQKATKFVKSLGKGTLLNSYQELTHNNLITITDDILQHISHASPHFSSVTIFHPSLKSVFIQKPMKTTIIPLAQSDATQNHHQTKRAYDFIWEQSREEIGQQVITRYIRSVLAHHLFQALISEHAARFVAMDSASNNADKMLTSLTLHYNKLRQASITKEVSELTASDR